MVADNIDIDKKNTVLHIGCCNGGLSHLLAKKCDLLVAKDINAVNINYCNNNYKGIDNNIIFECDDWKKTQSKYDVVVASHFHNFNNIEKVMKLAKRRIYIVDVTSLSAEEAICEALLPTELYKSYRRECQVHVANNYNYMFNMLYNYGIDANVKVLRCNITSKYASKEEAVYELEKIFVIPEGYSKEFRENVHNCITEESDGVLLNIEHRAALIYWDKD